MSTPASRPQSSHETLTSHQQLAEARQLAPYGLELVMVNNSVGLQGNTFPHDRALRRAGARWDPKAAAWIVDHRHVLDVFLQDLAGKSVGPTRELREASVPFGDHGESSTRLQKLLELGPHTLANDDLLVLLLSFDQYCPDPEALGKSLMAEFGRLGSILNAAPARLAKIEQVSPRTVALIKAARLLLERVMHEPLKDNPVLGSWQALIDYLTVKLSNLPNEQLIILYLDRKNKLIKEEAVQGTAHFVSICPRDVVAQALELLCSAIIVVHNHPSGDPTPSTSDRAITNTLRSALTPLDIALHDHLIIGRHRFYSFSNDCVYDRGAFFIDRDDGPDSSAR